MPTYTYKDNEDGTFQETVTQPSTTQISPLAEAKMVQNHIDELHALTTSKLAAIDEIKARLQRAQDAGMPDVKPVLDAVAAQPLPVTVDAAPELVAIATPPKTPPTV